jgi:hypothetical protein
MATAGLPMLSPIAMASYTQGKRLWAVPVIKRRAKNDYHVIVEELVDVP